ncbi:GNAT family N-acetyltransferase [Hahella sp. CCB-MM4]|uniref:GNAT family N-acetyltransferase n=1 Tax=Hahella sp. (strain CCB-MM4) TaxID=1926491 RepID=UPI000B9B3B89|nr:N-acetyltransferase [Hahella sp. CCB-MM4]OZG71734.1 GNAT family N-acetyltransferase [Hahella sp. CCB-MM4]
MVDIRPASMDDFNTMWNIFQSVIETGDALPFGESFDRDTFHQDWFTSHPAYVATNESGVIGMYKMGANYPDLGAHVSSATFLVSPDVQGKGVGRALVCHSLERARSEGFSAMQFNYVVSTNVAAVELYKSLGFSIAGTLPKAFRHKRLGLVDAYVMFRFL